MIIDGNTIKPGVRYDANICILGAGVAGITLAKELSEVFSDVYLVEAGGDQFSILDQDSFAAENKHPYMPDTMFSRLRMLGGSSNHWQNNTSPFSKFDFMERDWLSEKGWPIEFAEIEPYYARAEVYCGVGGDGYELAKWEKELQKKDLTAGSQALVSQIAKFSRPPVRFYPRFGEDLKNGDNVTIIKNAALVDIFFDPSTRKLARVGVVSPEGKQAEIAARIFIMCLGGIENARMLLAFNSKYENKLGNQSDCVGRFFMEHPTPRAAHLFPKDRDAFAFYQGVEYPDRAVGAFMALSEKALVENRITNLRIPFFSATQYELSDGISSFHILGDSLPNGEVPDQFGQHIVNVLSNLDDVADAVSRKKLDKKLFQSADEFAGFEIPMMMEQTPHRDNRVRLGTTKDRLGINRILLDWELKNDDRERVWTALEIVAKEVGALSIGRMKILKERAPRLWRDQLGFSDHHMGTTRMARSHADGVVDANQLVFGAENLFVSGSSVFSTGSHVPPTLTIVALSIRLAEYLKKEYRNG